MTPEEAMAAVASRLLRDLPAREVWAIGSRARGEATRDSDIDFLVVVEDSDLPGYQRARNAHSLVANIPFPKDIVVLTRREWRKQEHVVNTLPYIAQKEGILLHAS